MLSAMEHLFTIFLIVCIASSAMGATTIFNVMNYGAVGNGRTDDSQAFSRAWTAACQAQTSSSIPTVYIPQKRTFFLSPLQFSGPCKSSRIYFLVSGNLIAPIKTAWSGNHFDSWLLFYGIDGLVMKGKGVIDGRGSSWWPPKPCFNDPAHGMIFRRCNGLRLDGFTKINGPGTHILIMACNDALVSNLRIIAPGDSPNTDAINIASSKGVQIRNSFIATGIIIHVGDDCIAITAGSSDISVSGITCGPGHGISIGSLGSGGSDVVENVRVRNCTLKGTITGVRIKTLQGGKGYARNISFEGIKFIAVDNPIQIEQFYCPLKVNCQNDTSSAVAISDVLFSTISGTSIAENVINLSCSQSVGCTNIRLDRVYITSTVPGKKVYANCFNAHGKATRTKPAIKCLQP
ncbi:hypothetical protein RD792_015256 [Penstemon davidsonii]|uniref:Polygalacturonase n=1 Tax=Penstemon davidsonii TaxID=160366 RepID=A0ABR0CRN4_9LAMI|nr:hypothetical protein RD792_015256 [Penstemon davidsonii]